MLAAEEKLLLSGLIVIALRGCGFGLFCLRRFRIEECVSGRLFRIEVRIGFVWSVNNSYKFVN